MYEAVIEPVIETIKSESPTIICNWCGIGNYILDKCMERGPTFHPTNFWHIVAKYNTKHESNQKLDSTNWKSNPVIDQFFVRTHHVLAGPKSSATNQVYHNSSNIYLILYFIYMHLIQLRMTLHKDPFRVYPVLPTTTMILISSWRNTSSHPRSMHFKAEISIISLFLNLLLTNIYIRMVEIGY